MNEIEIPELLRGYPYFLNALLIFRNGRHADTGYGCMFTKFDRKQKYGSFLSVIQLCVLRCYTKMQHTTDHKLYNQ